MTVDYACWLSVQRFLAQEALSLDEKRWDDWLSLYRADAEYWVPAWTDEGELTADPHKEISLIYYSDRSGLEDRVYRIRTGRSSASTPPMRTCHMFTLLNVGKTVEGVSAETSWSVRSVRENATLEYFGRAEYELAPNTECDNGWVIARKKTIVINDRAKRSLDIYNI